MKATTKLSDALNSGLTKLGFIGGRELTFTRVISTDIIQMLSFDPVEKSPGVFKFGCGVGVRIPRVECFLDPSQEFPLRATIGLPIHLLQPEKRYFEWEFLETDDLDVLISSVVKQISDYAEPYLAEMNSLTAIRSKLESHNFGEWCAFSDEGRIQTLAALIAIMEGKDTAIRFLTDEIAKRKGKLRKYWSQLVTLMNRMKTL